MSILSGDNPFYDKRQFGVFEGKMVPLDSPMVEDEDPCWKDYEMIGMKNKNGKKVPNCVPKESIKEEEEGEKKPLNKPQRGGSKKFYVYVKDGDSIKKVSFGAKEGGADLSVKFDDKEARDSFSARHNCPAQKDKTSAAYWSCNLPRYAAQLGLKGGGDFYW